MEQEEPSPTKVEPAELEISLNEIAITLGSNTIRLIETIQGLPVVMLVDSGSTHYFIDSMVAKKTKLKVSTTKPLGVKFANEELIQTKDYCCAATLKVQGMSFYTSMHLPKLEGCDIVLGVTWLQTLWPIVWDFLHLIV